VIDLKDWQLPFGRRFRSLKLWFTLRSFGAAGVRRHLQSALDNAARFKQHIRASNGRYRLVAEPTHFALVCFQLVHPAEQDACPEDRAVFLAAASASNTSAAAASSEPSLLQQRNELNESLKESVSSSGGLFFITTQLSGESVCRLACNGEVQHGLDDVDHAWNVIEQHRKMLWAKHGWTAQAQH
jgi:glutamate/tyrosine decarboxylase-like PLP-dependent enzyme